MATIKQRVTIIETPTGWVHAQHDRKFRTIIAASKYVKNDAKRLAQNGDSVITMIDWQTNTPVGLKSVRAYTQSNEPPANS